MRKFKFVPICVVAALLLLAPASRAGIIQKDIMAIGADQSRSLFGQGAGVIIGVVDGGIDTTHPAIRNSVVASVDFSGSRTSDDDPSGTGHATGIAGVYLGNDTAGGYLGIAPQARLLNARVVTAKNATTDNMVGDGIFWAIRAGANVINLSLGVAAPRPSRSKLNLLVDYVAEHYNTSVVIAAGNDDNSALASAPNGSYNGLVVGAVGGRRFDTVPTFSNFALPNDPRSKPDLVAPGVDVYMPAANWEKSNDYYSGSGTSFSAPMVGGVMAQMISYGGNHKMPTSPMLLKAVLMTSTDHIYDSDGSTYSPRHVTNSADGPTVDHPLDVEQGAGRIDAVSAYKVYSWHPDATTPVATWRTSTLTGNGQYTLALGRLTAGEHLDTTLTWLRHVSVTGGKNWHIDDATFAQTVSLADFSLTLLLDGKKVITSDSSADNLENLSLDLSAAGDYSLEVYRFAGSGLADEDFALAARVLAAPVSRRARGVSSGRVPSAAGASTGATRAFEPVSVPEPTGVGVVILVVMILLQRGRRPVM